MPHHSGHRTRFVLCAAAVLLIAGLLWGLSGALAGSSPSPASGKTILKVGWTTDPDNLNPFVGFETSSFEIWSLNYDQLVEKNAKDFGPGPNGLAKSWDISPNGKVWTFHLQQGVKWQDGVPFSADDVAFTYNYIVDNNMYAFTVATDGIKKNGAVALDPNTVQITCKTPKADMLRLWIPILPKHIWANVSPSAAGNSYVNKPPIIGTGPFQTVEVKKGEYVRLVANKAYWRGAPHIDEIIFETYQNPDTMTSDLKTGTIDAAWGIPQAQFAPLKNTPGITAIAYNFFNWDYLNFNCLRPSFDYAAGWTKSYGNPVLQDPKFRTALNFAIDKQKLVEVAWAGNAQPGTTIMTPHSWSNPDYHWQPAADQVYPFDLAKAKAALDAAGYKDTNGDGVRDYKGKDITLQLWAPADNIQHQSEAKLIAGWFKAIGLNIKLEVLDVGVFNARIWNYEKGGNVYAPDFDMYIWDWDGYADPGQTLACYTAPQIGGWNEPCWDSPQFDALNAKQAAALDTTKRAQYIWQMQQLMYEQSPQVVLTYPYYLEGYNTDKWSGWTRVLNGHGPAFYTSGNIDTYLKLQPRAVAASGGAKGLWIGAGIAVVLVAAGLLVWWARRRRPAAVEAD